jgi:tetratricopeptide (TPR) repeat protein
LLEARECLEQAIEIDSNFADAYGWLSYCYFQGWATMWLGFDDNLDRAIELAEKGVALDGTSAIALTRLGWIQNFLRRYDQSIANLEKAILLAPNNADVIATFGQVLNYWGDPQRGLQMMEKAFSIDTIVPANWEFQRGLSHLLLHQYDEAIDRFNRAVEPPTTFFHAYLFLAWTYVELDRLDDANSAIGTLLEIIPHYTVPQAAGLYVFRADEVHARLLECLRKAGLPEG